MALRSSQPSQNTQVCCFDYSGPSGTRCKERCTWGKYRCSGPCCWCHRPQWCPSCLQEVKIQMVNQRFKAWQYIYIYKATYSVVCLCHWWCNRLVSGHLSSESGQAATQGWPESLFSVETCEKTATTIGSKATCQFLSKDSSSKENVQKKWSNTKWVRVLVPQSSLH